MLTRRMRADSKVSSMSCQVSCPCRDFINSCMQTKLRFILRSASDHFKRGSREFGSRRSRVLGNGEKGPKMKATIDVRRVSHDARGSIVGFISCVARWASALLSQFPHWGYSGWDLVLALTYRQDTWSKARFGDITEAWLHIRRQAHAWQSAEPYTRNTSTCTKYVYTEQRKQLA